MIPRISREIFTYRDILPASQIPSGHSRSARTDGMVRMAEFEAYSTEEADLQLNDADDEGGGGLEDDDDAMEGGLDIEVE